MSHQRLAFIPINRPNLDTVLTNLATTGIVKIAENDFVYLDIDDGYINAVYPLIGNANTLKPDYFSAETSFIGAHISIAYPDEHMKIEKFFIGTEHIFKVLGLVTTTLLNKHYYALHVRVPTLTAIRVQHDLPAQLQTEGYLVDFHITVGKQYLD